MKHIIKEFGTLRRSANLYCSGTDYITFRSPGTMVALAITFWKPMKTLRLLRDPKYIFTECRKNRHLEFPALNLFKVQRL
jgi:hypothetical protein